MDTEKQLALLQQTVEQGFKSFGERLDDLKDTFGALTDRVHKMELQVAGSQMSELRKDVDSLIAKSIATEVEMRTAGVKSKFILAAVGFVFSIVGAVITHILTKA